jgi:membrane-bound ClpP family serine protease
MRHLPHDGFISRKDAKNCRRMWSGRVLARYWSMQLPGIVIVILFMLAAAKVFEWPQWIVWTVAVVWVAKEAIVYAIVWRVYDPSYPSTLPYPADGAKGTAADDIDASGIVRIVGELWRAELAQGARRIKQGEPVRVIARHGLTLVVEPDDPGGCL